MEHTPGPARLEDSPNPVIPCEPRERDRAVARMTAGVCPFLQPPTMMRLQSTTSVRRATASACALTALALLSSLGTAQDCADDYLTTQVLPAPAPPLEWSKGDPSQVYQTISGGGSALADLIADLESHAFSFGALPWIIRVEPLQAGEANYAPISLDMLNYFTAGLTLFSKEGPATAIIDGSGLVPAITVMGGSSNLQIGYALSTPLLERHG